MVFKVGMGKEGYAPWLKHLKTHCMIFGKINHDSLMFYKKYNIRTNDLKQTWKPTPRP